MKYVYGISLELNFVVSLCLLGVSNDGTQVWRLGLIFQIAVITFSRTHTICDVFWFS